MTTMSKMRTYRGPALFSYGFRPFFLAGALYAGAVIPLWLSVFAGATSLPTVMIPRDWHVHEMLFGFVASIIAGFLLTAVPNWTGRLPIQGWPLAILFSSWIAGRLAVNFSGSVGWIAAMALDAAFLLMLAGATAREIIAGRKWGNLKVVGIVNLLAATNIAFHLEAHFHGIAEYSTRFGIALVVMLIGIIGGRIVPSFTRNWLARQSPGRLPIPFSRFDAIAMVASGAALLLWIIVPVGMAAADHPAVTVGRLSHLPRSAGADPARRLRVHSGRLFSRGAGVARSCRRKRRYSCLDRRCNGNDDAGRDVARVAWSYRPPARSVVRHANYLCRSCSQRAGAHLRCPRAGPCNGIPLHLGSGLDGRVPRLRSGLWAAAVHAAKDVSLLR